MRLTTLLVAAAVSSCAPGAWAAFGFIAAEADLLRMKEASS